MVFHINNLNLYYQFDHFIIDVKNQCLTFKSEKISDDERTLKLLCLLCDNFPTVVEKDELLEKIWPEQVVTEWSLSKLVSDVRHLLDEHIPDQDYIKTIRGRGFRFNHPVEISDNLPEPKEKKIEARTSEHAVIDGKKASQLSNSITNKYRWWLIAASLFVLILIVGVQFNIIKLNPDTINNESVNAQNLRVAILPVESESGKPINEWIKYGVMSLTTEQLSRYHSINTLPSSDVITAISSLEPGLLKKNYSEFVRLICRPLGCSKVIAIRYHQDNNNNHVLSYQIYDQDNRSRITEFTESDVIDAASVMMNFLVTDLIPTHKSVIHLTDTYSDNSKANRDYSIGVSELLSGDASSALSYLRLAVERKPDFFWANARLAEAHYRSGQLDLASKITNRLKSETDDPKRIYFLDHLKSNILYSLGKLDDSLQLSLSLQQNSFAVDNPLLMGNELLNIGGSYQAKGDLTKALNYLHKARKQYQSAKYAAGEGKVLFNIANVYLTLSKKVEAINYYQKALEIFLQFDMSGYAIMSKHQIATTNIALGKIKYAEGELTRLIKEYQAIGDTEGELTVYLDLVWAKIAQNLLLEAESQSNALIKKLENSQFSYIIEHSLKMATHIQLKLGHYSKAQQYFNQIKGTWSDQRPVFAYMPAHIKLVQGDFQSALLLAEEVKSKLGPEFTQQHEKILKQFQLAAKLNKVVTIDYSSN